MERKVKTKKETRKIWETTWSSNFDALDFSINLARSFSADGNAAILHKGYQASLVGGRTTCN